MHVGACIFGGFKRSLFGYLHWFVFYRLKHVQSMNSAVSVIVINVFQEKMYVME